MANKMTRFWTICALVTCAVWSTARAEVRIVHEGKNAAVVVTADNPAMVATYAAEELVRHIEKATGQQLEIVAEKKHPGKLS